MNILMKLLNKAAREDVFKSVNIDFKLSKYI